MKRYIPNGFIILIAIASLSSLVFARQSDPNPNRIRAITWSPDGTRIAVSNNNGVTKVFNAMTNQVLLPLQSDTAGPTVSVSWSPYGTKLATGGADNVVRVWDVTTGQNLTSFPLQYADFISSVAWSPDGSKLAASTYNGIVQIWNTSTNQLITSFTKGQITQISWNAASSKLALSAGVVVEIWNAINGQFEYRLAAHNAIVIDVSWRKNSTMLVSASADRTLKTWDASTGQVGMTFMGHTDAVNAVDWNPTNNQFASVSQDGSLRIWDSGNGQLVKTVTSTSEPLFSIAYHPSGNQLAYGGDSGVVQIIEPTPTPTRTPTPYPCPCSLWTTSTVPAYVDVLDASPIELGVKFQSSIPALVTGARFHRGPLNTGPHTAHLWTSTGTLLASATFTNETASGWQSVAFAAPVAISANTVYIISYHSPTGRFSVNTTPYFTTPWVSGPLTAPAHTAANPNAVFARGSSPSFPTLGSNFNYWVDVVILPASAATATPTPTRTPTKTPTASATPTATRTPTVSPTSTGGAFPTSAVLDTFNRANGGMGSSWAGQTSCCAIVNNQLKVDVDGTLYWNTASFGATQEVYVTLSTIDVGASEIDLLLKVQGSTWTSGVIEVLYDPAAHVAQVYTYTSSQGWVQRGADLAVTFVPGDRFGARARSNGTVEVYRNNSLLGSRDISAWPYNANGGKIGLWFLGVGAMDVDDFGGG